MDILGAEEKLAFSAHVATLRALGLTYVRDESGGGQDYRNPHAPADSVRLEPEIDNSLSAGAADSFGTAAQFKTQQSNRGLNIIK